VSAYDLTRHAIQAAQWLVVPALMYVLRRAPILLRLLAVVVLGWAGVLLLVLWYWNYAIHHAPTEQLAEYFALRDGAEISMTYMFGWLYVIVYMALVEAVRFTVSWAKRCRDSSHAV
jgi:hypothetical protein